MTVVTGDNKTKYHYGPGLEDAPFEFTMFTEGNQFGVLPVNSVDRGHYRWRDQWKAFEDSPNYRSPPPIRPPNLMNMEVAPRKDGPSKIGKILGLIMKLNFQVLKPRSLVTTMKWLLTALSARTMIYDLQ